METCLFFALEEGCRIPGGRQRFKFDVLDQETNIPRSLTRSFNSDIQA
jgi:hypothetical protein